MALKRDDMRLDFVVDVMTMMSINYEASRYAIFSTFLLLRVCWAQIFSSTLCGVMVAAHTTSEWRLPVFKSHYVMGSYLCWLLADSVLLIYQRMTHGC
jgi:hypothetical protein